MRARVLAAMLFGSLAACCSAPTATSPPAPQTASPSSAPATSTAFTPTASPVTSTTGRPLAQLRVPIPDTAFPAASDGEGLVLTQLLPDGRSRLEVMDLATRAVTTVRDALDTSLSSVSLRDGVLVYTELGRGPEPFQTPVRVFAGRWRDPASFVRLDDLVIATTGGDAWNPWPAAQTNGWEVAWQHKSGDGPYELRLREADGRARVAYSSTTPFSFALARNGDVAIGDVALANQTAAIALRLYSGGSVRVLLQRPASGSGLVYSQPGHIVWTNGIGIVINITTAERVDIATLQKETVSPPAGCTGFAGVMDSHIGFHCDNHVDFVDGGRVSVGPPIPILYPRAALLDLVGSPRVVVLTLEPTDDPRPGAGARF